MLLRLFRVVVLAGLLIWAAECLNLADMLSEAAQTVVAGWGQTLDR
jgi:hypothetical protein